MPTEATATRVQESCLSIELSTVSFRVAQPVGRANDAESVVQVVRPIFDRLDADREHLVLLSLDAGARVRGYKVVSTGTDVSSLVTPRMVFRDACALGATRIIVAHNHPGGDMNPSAEDLSATARLIEAGRLLGIELEDHLILGATEWVSLRRARASWWMNPWDGSVAEGPRTAPRSPRVTRRATPRAQQFHKQKV